MKGVVVPTNKYNNIANNENFLSYLNSNGLSEINKKLEINAKTELDKYNWLL